MPSPSDPIKTDEGILRRIPNTWWAPDKDDIPQVMSFCPRKPNKRIPGDTGDTDGLSISREILTPIGQLQSAGSSGKIPHIARLIAQNIYSLGLTIEPKPISGDVGHCVIPELNITTYLSSKYEKDKIIAIADALARKAQLAAEAPTG